MKTRILIKRLNDLKKDVKKMGGNKFLHAAITVKVTEIRARKRNKPVIISIQNRTAK